MKRRSLEDLTAQETDKEIIKTKLRMAQLLALKEIQSGAVPRALRTGGIRRGRPKGSKNKPEPVASVVDGEKPPF